MLEWLGLQDVPGVSLVLRVASLVVSLVISWLLFTWIIARLPRESVSFRSAARAGLLAAVGVRGLQAGGVDLPEVGGHGPAGATFGPVLGLMVFAYITARLILFATAWAATSTENLSRRTGRAARSLPQITPRVQVREGLGVRGALAAVAVGALGALGLSRLTGAAEVSAVAGGSATARQG